ncbi:MAG: hypothetical protein HZB29_08770 [Nitrospinae bacterium]|nr:hypothetical protein [Nitrospinota bacterium]
MIKNKLTLILALASLALAPTHSSAQETPSGQPAKSGSLSLMPMLATAQVETPSGYSGAVDVLFGQRNLTTRYYAPAEAQPAVGIDLEIGRPGWLIKPFFSALSSTKDAVAVTSSGSRSSTINNTTTTSEVGAGLKASVAIDDLTIYGAAGAAWISVKVKEASTTANTSTTSTSNTYQATSVPSSATTTTTTTSGTTTTTVQTTTTTTNDDPADLSTATTTITTSTTTTTTTSANDEATDNWRSGLFGVAGIAYRIWGRMSLGVQVRTLTGTEVNLSGVKGDGNYTQYAATLGWSF